MVICRFLRLFLLAMFVPESLMRIYTPDTALIKIGASYLRIVSFSYLFSGVTQCYFMMMKIGEKRQKRDDFSCYAPYGHDNRFFLIYGVAGVPKLGSDGSAYSTVVVEFVALVWCIAESHRGKYTRTGRLSTGTLRLLQKIPFGFLCRCWAALLHGGWDFPCTH